MGVALSGIFPPGATLPAGLWRSRHHVVVALLALHVPLVLGLARAANGPMLGAAAGAGALAAAAAISLVPTLPRRARTLLAAGGLLACSLLVGAYSQGAIGFELHFFATLAVLSLYQEWSPFAAAVLLLILHDGLLGAGVLQEGGLGPWRLALVHGVFVAIASAAYVAQWRWTESVRADSERILESAADGLLGIDLRGRIRFVNPTAETLLGMPATRLLGRPLPEVLPTIRLPGPGRPAPGPAQEMQLTGGRGTVPVEYAVSPSLRRGVLQGHVLVLRDISQRREAEAERLRVREEQVRLLRELDVMKTQFLNNAAHELRNPLTALGFQVEYLALRLASSNPHDQKAVAILQRNFDRLRFLVDDVANFSRLEAGRLQVEQAEVRLSEAIADVVGTFEPVATAHGITIAADCPPDLLVWADPLRLSQILSNLVTNALRYTDGPGRVHLSCQVAAGRAEVRVADTGRGLAASQMERLFQPFSQVHEQAPAQRLGSGLGLHITRSLVELHGGSIHAESDGPGKGSTFRFTLPLPGESGNARRGEGRHTGPAGMEGKQAGPGAAPWAVAG